MQAFDIAHSVSARLEIRASTAFAFLLDPRALSRWSLGCMDLQPVGNGVYTGHSLFDGSQGWLSIDGCADRLLVDYHIGTADVRQPRISARVVPGPVCGLPDTCCSVTLTAWRSLTMTQERWRRLCATHEAEIWLIKAQAEAAQVPQQPPNSSAAKNSGT